MDNPTFTHPLLQGVTSGIVGSNTTSLKNLGKSEFDATTQAIKLSKTGRKSPVGHPKRHKNLGKFLHPKKVV